MSQKIKVLLAVRKKIQLLYTLNNDIIITTTQFSEKYTSHFIWKGCVWVGVGVRTELQHIALCWVLAFSTTDCLPNSPISKLVWSPKLNWKPEGSLFCRVLAFSTASFLQLTDLQTGLVSKLTDFLSSPSYIIVQLPSQYLPITDHRNESLPPSLEWHV